MPYEVKLGRNKRMSFSKIQEKLVPPNLIEIQTDSFKQFIEEGIKTVLREFSPVEVEHKKTGKTSIEFVSYEIHTGDKIYSSEAQDYITKSRLVKESKTDFEETEVIDSETNKLKKVSVEKDTIFPKYTEQEAREKDSTFEAPLFIKVRQTNEQTGIVEEDVIYFGKVPLMTKRGTFIYNGSERVIVSQLSRSPGAICHMKYQHETSKQRYEKRYEIIPYRGTWLEFEMQEKGGVKYYVKLDKAKKIPLTTFLKYFGMSEDEIKNEFNFDEGILNTLEQDSAVQSKGAAAVLLYDKLRPNQPITENNATKHLDELFYNIRRYDFERVGRYQFNKKVSFLNQIIKKYKGNNLKTTLSQDVKKEPFINKKTGEVLDDSILGFPKDGEIIAEKGTEVTTELLKDLENKGVKKIFIKVHNDDFPDEVMLISNGFGEIDIPKVLGMEFEQLYFPKKIHIESFLEIINEEQILPIVKRARKTNTDKFIVTSALSDKKNYRKYTGRHLSLSDVIAAVNFYVNLNNDYGNVDDIDNLSNRRVKTVGELLQNQFRIGMTRIEKGIKERLAAPDAQANSGGIYLNTRPIYAVLHEFFASSELSQFMDENNPLSEMKHKRRVTSLGPGGIGRDSATLEIRDIHATHYGRICPTETPEGQNIGLINSLAIYTKVNEFGFLETPYRKVKNGVVTDEVKYFAADEEEGLCIANSNEPTNANGKYISNQILGRGYKGQAFYKASEIDYAEISPKQVVSVATALIPFLENDDGARALMGANMQGQAVPLLVSEAPRIATGIEHLIAKDSGIVVLAKEDGVVSYVSADVIKVKNTTGKEDTYNLLKFKRSNQGTLSTQKPIVFVGEKVKKGEVIADGPATAGGELALGRNLLIGFMTYEGYNYEDAVILSEKLAYNDILTSIHIEKHDIDARETKLGPEEITSDIPGSREEYLFNLDSKGIIAIGTKVKAGDILVGKITPKGETDLSPEEKLIRSIFGGKAKEVRDSSLRVPNGGDGIVIGVKEFDKETDDLPNGVLKRLRVYIATKRKISVGDKMAGRHGNKGVISNILPVEDMPYLENGTPLDVMLNPLGVPSRMNIGQVLEVHLGLVAKYKDYYVSTPIFDGATTEDIKQGLIDVGLPETGQLKLRNGKTGEYFEKPITVGYMYMLKLHHLVDDKIHARATGPYSIVSQQPLGGKAQRGGQRFGEMEVWALEAYGAAYTLQEILTVKSDDMFGRLNIFDAIIKNKNAHIGGVPESFKVLIKELNALGIDVKLFEDEGNETFIPSVDDKIFDSKIEKFMKQIDGPESIEQKALFDMREDKEKEAKEDGDE